MRGAVENQSCYLKAIHSLQIECKAGARTSPDTLSIFQHSPKNFILTCVECAPLNPMHANGCRYNLLGFVD